MQIGDFVSILFFLTRLGWPQLGWPLDFTVAHVLVSE